MAQLRIGLTLSGAVALGAYEGGALAALLVALRRLRTTLAPDAVVVDAIAGASAGSMTGLLAARCLLSAADPVAVFERAWVTAPSLEALRAPDDRSPLSAEAMRAVAEELLGDSVTAEDGPPQPEPVQVEMALGALRGLGYRFDRLGPDPSRRPPPLDATTYLDWESRRFAPGDGPAAFRDAVDAAFASGAHAAAFPSRGLDRSARAADYAKAGVTNFPAGGFLWYTDGGTVDNQPLGRALDVTGPLDDADPESARLHLVVIPDPSFGVPATARDWADKGDQPAWTPTAGRALAMGLAQSLFDDLRAAEKTNSRLRWTGEVAETLARALGPAAGPELAELVARVEGERAELGTRAATPPPPPAPDTPVADLVERALHAASGLHGKRPVHVDAISPALLGAADRDASHRLLAGEKLAHFGGFLDEKLRRHDFALGYRSAQAWLEDAARGPAAHGIPADALRPALKAVGDRAPALGEAPSGNLGVKGWLELSRLLAHTVKVVLRDARKG